MEEQNEAASSRGGDSGHTSLLPPLKPGPQTPAMLTLRTVSKQNTFNRATPRSARGLSRKIQAVLKKQRFDLGEPRRSKAPTERETFQARNWKQLSEKELKKLSLIERSRYMAYEPEPKDVLDKRLATLKRVQLNIAAEREEKRGPTMDEVIESEWDSGLVGHLKAAEARNRLRSMRIGYERNKSSEISHLIASQQSSIEAVRLKCLLQGSSQYAKPQDFLAKHERERCETLLEDETGLATNRTL